MNKFPLIKFVILFICGIIFQSIFNIKTTGLITITGVFIIVYAVLLLVKTDKFNSYKSIISFTALFFTGSLYLSISNASEVKYPFQNPKLKNVTLSGKIITADLIKEGRLTFTVETEKISVQGKEETEKFNVLVNIYDSDNQIERLYSKMRIGNRVDLKGTLSRPADERNPGEFNYEKYLASKNISALFSIYNSGGITIYNDDIAAFPNMIFQSRKYLDGLISKLHNNSTSALLRGLLLADRGLIDKDIKEQFVNAGVIHVLAVSGLHVGFVVLIFIFLFKRFNVYLRYLLTIFGLLLFLIITNMPASVTRATVMALAMIAAPLTGRSYNSINSLALAALIILLFDPNQLFTPGFQLSFAAVLSIVIIYPLISSYINQKNIKSNTLKYVLLFCAVSFAAQIGTLPFSLMYFHKLSVVSLFVNILVIPLIGLIVGLGIFTILIGTFSLAAGGIFASTNELLCYILFKTVGIFGGQGMSYITIFNFSAYDSVIFYLGLGLLINYWHKFKVNSARVIFIILLVCTGFLWIQLDNNSILQPDKLSVLAIDVGQGDSFLLKFPDDKTALIDAGDATQYFDNGKNVILPLLEKFGIEKIDYAFISHVDADHYRGFLPLINEGKIGQLYKPKIDSTLRKDVELERYIKSFDIPVHYYSKSIIPIDNVRVYILNDTTQSLFSSFDTNDKSGILKIVYGNNSFLFTGDAEAKAEKFYSKNYTEFLRSDVLKVGHHGSRTSSTNSFLDYVHPELAVISCGIANRFGHPSMETMEKLEDRNVKVYRTDLSGAVLLKSDGYQVKNINWKKEESGFIF